MEILMGTIIVFMLGCIVVFIGRAIDGISKLTDEVKEVNERLRVIKTDSKRGG